MSAVPPADGTFTIKSVREGLAPTGVPNGATPPDPIPIVINAVVTTWTITQQAGDNVFQFTIDNYGYTTVVDNIVTATADATPNSNWFARYIESQNAYTIETNDSLGNAWTVAPSGSDDAPIEITPIPTTGSNPPQFAPTDRQLFQFYTA